MKTTQTKRGRPVGSKNKMTTKITVGGKVKIKPGDGSEFPEIDKFKTNPFAKKYKKSLHEFNCASCGKLRGSNTDCCLDAIESANQVKSWKRGGISETVNLTYLFLGVIIGFSVCAIVVTPIIISLV